MRELVEKESMIFFASFFNAIKDLPPEDFKRCACTILEYGLYGRESENDGVERLVLTLAKPVIDNSNARYQSCVENGKKGGAPKGNTNAKKKKNTNDGEKKNNPKQPKTTQINLNEDKNKNKNKNENKNENENENVDKDVHANENTSAKDGGSDGEPSKSTRTYSESGKSVFGEYKNVFLTQSEKEKLHETLGKERLELSLEHLSRYIKRKPAYSSASHFEDLRGWVQDSLSEKRSARDGPYAISTLHSSKSQSQGSSFDFDLSDIFEKPEEHN